MPTDKPASAGFISPAKKSLTLRNTIDYITTYALRNANYLGESNMKTKFQGQVTGDGYGFVYVMSYPGSDKVKIGHALNPTTRAKDIGGTMAPETPVLEAYFWCSERREAVERAAHKIEAATRCNGEWFAIPVHRAVDVIRQAAASVGVAVTLAYDRNQWEAQAAAEKAAKLAALPTMADDALNGVYYQVNFAWSKANPGKPVVFTDPYAIAVRQEVLKRREAELQEAAERQREAAEVERQRKEEQTAARFRAAEAAERQRKEQIAADALKASRNIKWATVCYALFVAASFIWGCLSTSFIMGIEYTAIMALFGLIPLVPVIVNEGGKIAFHKSGGKPVDQFTRFEMGGR